MSEDLVLFRSEAGEVGLLGLNCPHRNADLSFGRVEDGGLRCPYHGWLFDVRGRCLDQPNVPADQRRPDQIRQKYYPCIERGGFVWTFMGPGGGPELPALPFMNAAEGHLFTLSWFSSCNYLQALEGNIDPSHLSFLHRMDLSPEQSVRRSHVAGFATDTAPRISLAETSYGFRLLAERTVKDDGTKLLRATNFIMPNAAAANGHETEFGIGGCTVLWHVPIDDHSHMRFEAIYHVKSRLPLDEYEAARLKELDADGARRRTMANRYLQDRSEMARTFAGVGQSFSIHDLFVTESMGQITDHRTENLTVSDIAIGRARRDLLQAMDKLEADGQPPATSASDFHDLVVFTATVDKETNAKNFTADMVSRQIYKPAIDLATESQLA
jgi:phthalate 4,5-dioxygenase